MTDTRSAVRALALAGILTLVLGAAGCGGSDGDAATAGEAPPSPTIPGAVKTPAEQELLDAHDALVAALKAGDAETYCASITADSRRRMPKYVGASSCETMVAKFGASDAAKGRPGPKVTDVTIDGNRGGVEKRAPKGADPTIARFVKQDGEWLGLLVPAIPDDPR